MTSSELRRLAGEKIAAAASLVADAALLRSQAAELDGILDPLVPISQRVWVGPAAEDFESAVRAHGSVLRGEVLRLIDIATDLERRAQIARGEAAELRARALATQLVADAGLGVV